MEPQSLQRLHRDEASRVWHEGHKGDALYYNCLGETGGSANVAGCCGFSDKKRLSTTDRINIFISTYLNLEPHSRCIG